MGFGVGWRGRSRRDGKAGSRGGQGAGEGRELPLSQAAVLSLLCGRQFMASFSSWELLRGCQQVLILLPVLLALAPLPLTASHSVGRQSCCWARVGSGRWGSRDSPGPWCPPRCVCCILCELVSL